MAALEAVPPPDIVRAELGETLRRLSYLRRLLRLAKDVYDNPPSPPRLFESAEGPRVQEVVRA